MLANYEYPMNNMPFSVQVNMDHHPLRTRRPKLQLVQIFCARPKIYLQIVVVTNILCQTKRQFAFSKIGFCAGPKVFEEALDAVKFLGWSKFFMLDQQFIYILW